MIQLAKKQICTGCAACSSVCARNAIAMVADDEGFRYPVVDMSLCVGCGKCRLVCPALNASSARRPNAVYAAISNDEELRNNSSSGGVFSILATQVLATGGIIYGAAFDRKDWHVFHRSAESQQELAELRGSKYVQSDIGQVYHSALENLERGRKVLFSGTPCQVAAFRNFLGRDWDNLLLVDVVCHGAPSPLAWQKYLQKRTDIVQRGNRNGTVDGSTVREVSLRNKSYGWQRYSVSILFSNGETYLREHQYDSFIQAFLKELCTRPSCHFCPVRELRSGADLTIGDYWRVRERHPAMDDDKGTSLVLVNTNKGRCAFEGIEDFLCFESSSYEDAVRVNPAILLSPVINDKRAAFFSRLVMNDFDDLVLRLSSASHEFWGMRLVKRVLRKIRVG